MPVLKKKFDQMFREIEILVLVNIAIFAFFKPQMNKFGRFF